ncbi:MAG: hypothetical protein EON59_00745 [Alphaproteobacteria bacterium]|nr:MAG: hypothetical protein EON59_00745 [Alphaproteobacteria bacterium]
MSASVEQIPAEVVERMVALVRRLARGPNERGRFFVQNVEDEARELIALLPEPVDPDLLEARELFIALEGGVDADRDVIRDILQGKADCADEIRHLLAGIKRGRELASAGQ